MGLLVCLAELLELSEFLWISLPIYPSNSVVKGVSAAGWIPKHSFTHSPVLARSLYSVLCITGLDLPYPERAKVLMFSSELAGARAEGIIYSGMEGQAANS